MQLLGVSASEPMVQLGIRRDHEVTTTRLHTYPVLVCHLVASLLKSSVPVPARTCLVIPLFTL